MLDFFVRPGRENAKAVYAALAKSSAPLAGFTADDFIEGDKHFRIGHVPAMFKIVPETKGVDFDAARGTRVETVVDPESGLTALLISRGDL